MQRFHIVPLFLFVLMLNVTCSPVRIPRVEFDPVASTGDLRFIVDSAVFRGGSDSLRVNLFLKFPNSMLSFSKEGNTFRAGYEGTVAVTRRGGRQFVTEEFEGRLVADSYETAHGIYIFEHRTFHLHLKPGRYDIEVTLLDRNSQRRGKILRDLNLVSFPDDGISLSSIVFTETIEDDSTGSLDPVPNPDRIYGERVPELNFQYEVYLPESYQNRTDLKTEYELVSWKHENRILLEEGDMLPSTPGIHDVRGATLLREIKEEDVELVVRVVDGEGNTLAERKGLFYVYWPLLNWGDDFELSLAQLKLVAQDDVIGRYEKLPPEDRESFLKAYWVGRDPVPQTKQNELQIEFERRLRHTKRYLGDIWTDKGKVYVQNGPPHEMTKRMIRDVFGYTRPAEIWIYHDPYREFQFIDDRLVRR